MLVVTAVLSCRGAVLRPEPAADGAVHAAGQRWHHGHRVCYPGHRRRHGGRDVRESVVGLDPGWGVGRQVLAGKTVLLYVCTGIVLLLLLLLLLFFFFSQ